MDGRDNRRSTPTERAQTQVVTTRVLSRKEGLYDGQAAVVLYPRNRAQTHHNDDIGRLPSLTPCLLLQSEPGSVGSSPACSHCSRDAPACAERREEISREPLCLQDMRLFCSALHGGEFFWNLQDSHRQGNLEISGICLGKVVEINVINQIIT